MIVLDTHVWVWHVQGDRKLPKKYRQLIEESEPVGLGVSSISLWEVAKAVEHGRMDLPRPLDDWFAEAIGYPGVTLFDLTQEIVIESTRLPGNFHKDPADQIIVATARILDSPLLTVDTKILKYQHVKLARK